MTANEYVHKLLELSSSKLKHLSEIQFLTERQCVVIENDNMNELNEIIDSKQIQMNIIDELDQAFDVYYSRLKSILGVQSLEEIKMSELSGAIELKQMVVNISEIIKNIQHLEDVNNRKVKDILSKVSSEIRQIKQGKLVNNGYNIGSKLLQQSYYFDRKK